MDDMDLKPKKVDIETLINEWTRLDRKYLAGTLTEQEDMFLRDLSSQSDRLLVEYREHLRNKIRGVC